jgi:predicted RNA-binding protein YlxR (DUF448 family)
MVKPKHIPVRTCVACRTADAKRGLLRVVRQPDGSVAYDPKGKMPGRGAYVCARPACIAMARKQKKLERSLKSAAIPEALYRELEEHLEGHAGVAGPGGARPGSDPLSTASAPSNMPVSRQQLLTDRVPSIAVGTAESGKDDREGTCGAGPQESEK